HPLPTRRSSDLLEVRSASLEHDAGLRFAAELAEVRLAAVEAREQAPGAAAKQRVLARRDRRLEKPPADRAAAGGHQHLGCGGRWACSRCHDIARVMEASLECACGAEGALEAREARVAVHEDAIEKARGKLRGLLLAIGARLQEIAHGANDQGPRRKAPRVLEERHQLEAHLPPAEGKELDEEHVCAQGAPHIEERRRAAPLPRLV